MTPAQLAAIKSRADAATPGPWVVGERYGGVVAPGSSLDPANDAAYGGYLVGESMGRHNSEFIAAAREDVPALLDEVERLSRVPSDIKVVYRPGTFAHDEAHRALDGNW